VTAHKSEEMAEFAQQNNWRTSVKTDMSGFEETGDINDITWIMYAIRGDEDKKETLRVEWDGDLQTWALYQYGDYVLKPARKAPVLKLIQGQPDPKKYRKEEKKTEPETIEEKLANRNIPWENDDSPAFDILISVLDTTITWISPVTGEERSALCPKQGNLRKAHFKVKTTSSGKRVLEWANSYGFQACYISNIIDVT
jgi:hypothetical protein